MYLIIKYPKHPESTEDSPFPADQEWLPTWRIDGPDEQPELQRGATVSLSGEARLPILQPGEALNGGETYLDLRQPSVGPFRALEGQTAGCGNAYIAQGNLTPAFWNQLVRVCSRAGALALDAGRRGPPVNVTMVLEPVAAPAVIEAVSVEPGSSFA